MEAIRVKLLREGAKLPTYGSAEAAGADLYACVEGSITIAPGETVFIPTGIALEVPKGCAGLVYARSGYCPGHFVGVLLTICLQPLVSRIDQLDKTLIQVSVINTVRCLDPTSALI